MDFTTILQQAWTRLRRHRGLLILCTIITAIPGMIDRWIEQWFYTIPGAWMMVSSSSLETTEQVLVAPYDWSYNLMMIVTLILGSWLWIGYIQAILTITDDQKPILEQLFGAKAITVARYLGASFLYLCGIGLGLLLFIIPGIWLALRWHLYNYYIAQGYGVIDSLKASWNVTRGYISKIMAIGFSMLLWYILIFSVWVALAIVILQQINVPISDTSMIDI